MSYSLSAVYTTDGTSGDHVVQLTGLLASGVVIDSVGPTVSCQVVQSSSDMTKGIARIRMRDERPGVAAQLQRGDDNATGISHFAAVAVASSDAWNSGAEPDAGAHTDDGVLE